MAKLAVVLLMAAFISQGSSKPYQPGDIAKAVMGGDWNKVQDMLKQFTLSRQPGVVDIYTPSYDQSGATSAGAGSLPGRYYSQREYSYQRATNNNGVVSEDKGGLGVINDNGKIQYYQPNGVVPSYGVQVPNYYQAPYNTVGTYQQGR